MSNTTQYFDRPARLLAAVFVAACAGCSTPNSIPPPLTDGPVEFGENIIGRPAPMPEGVVTYCWEEPMVMQEANGPGLNTERTWYSPSYIAIRKVRGGKWRPCRPVPNELAGETTNER